MALTGCVYDKYTPESCPETGKDKYYMSFALQSTGQMAPATKASLEDRFETRTIEEHLIGKVDIYFYDASGKYQTHRVATYNNTTPSDIDVTFEEQKMQEDGVAVGGYAQFTVELDERPYKILLLVNQPYDLVDKTLSEAKIVKQEKETSYKSGVSVTVTYTPQGGTETTTSVDPFFMSSVSYASAYGAPVCEQDVSSFYLQATKDDAKAHPMSVYVERMAAKVTVKTNGQTESAPGQTAYTIPVVTPQNNLTGKVTIQKWGLNALNRYSYRFKQIDPAWNFSWNWNSNDKKRSYWGEDPNYAHVQNSSVSQTQLVTPGDDEQYAYIKPAAISADFGTSLYCLENTSDADALPLTDTDDNDTDPTLYTRATHVLILSELSFELTEGTDDAGYTTESDFFRYKGVFYTRKNLVSAIMQDVDQKYYKKDGTDFVLLDGDDVDIVSAAGLPYCKGHDYGERVALQLKDGVTAYTAQDDASEYTGNRILNLTEMGTPVRIDGFKDGVFYYKIPVEHINNDALVSGVTTYPVGRYGVVRNHNYSISLGTLEGIGTGIWDDSVDIRPYRKPGDYIVSANIKITPWIEFVQNFLFVDPSGMLVTMGQGVLRWEDIGSGTEGDKDNDWQGGGWYE